MAEGGELVREAVTPSSDDGRTAASQQPTSRSAVEVRRSARRRRTVSAYQDGETTVVLLPARMTRRDEEHWVEVMLTRLGARDARRRPSDEALLARADVLSRRYLDGGARPESVRWSSNQLRRWGSCTPADGAIRISARVQGMPPWVLDYVLLHEMAHLLEPSHDEAFWNVLAVYPRTERARGYLEGVAASTGLAVSDD